VETERLVIRGELHRATWCATCGKATPRVSIEQAAMLIRADVEVVLRMSDDGLLHTARTREGGLSICLRSLPAPGGESGEPST
jgi:hypothetical protein